jgi:MFS family permease
MRKAFAQKGFGHLFTGVSTSMFGDSVMLIVLSMWVKSLTGSNAAAGMTFFWLVLPSLFAPLFGLFVDRVRRRPLLVWANVASAICVLPLLLVRDAGDVWLIYAVAFVYGISFVVIPAGLNGLLKEVMPPALLVEANASLQTIKESFRLVGPLAGAALFSALGGGAVAVVDAASFLVAAAVIGSMRVHEDQPVRSAQHWRFELTEGIRHIWYDVLLRHTLVALGVTVLVVGFSESAIFAVTDAFGRPVEFIGVLLTVQGVGAIAGGLTASRIVRRCGEAGTLAVSLAVLAVGAVLMALAPSLWLVFLAVVTFGYALPPMMIAFGTLMQLRTPSRLMGRVSTANDVVLGTPQTVSIAVGALLVSLIDYRLIFAIMAGVTAAAAAYLAIALRSSLFASHAGESSATAVSLAEANTVAPVSGVE